MQRFLQGKYKTIVRQKPGENYKKSTKHELFDKLRLVENSAAPAFLLRILTVGTRQCLVLPGNDYIFRIFEENIPFPGDSLGQDNVLSYSIFA